MTLANLSCMSGRMVLGWSVPLALNNHESSMLQRIAAILLLWLVGCSFNGYSNPGKDVHTDELVEHADSRGRNMLDLRRVDESPKQPRMFRLERGQIFKHFTTRARLFRLVGTDEVYVAMSLRLDEFECITIMFLLDSLRSRAASVEVHVYHSSCGAAGIGWAKGLRGTMSYCVSPESLSIQLEPWDTQGKAGHVIVSETVPMDFNGVIEYRPTLESMVDW